MSYHKRELHRSLNDDFGIFLISQGAQFIPTGEAEAWKVTSILLVHSLHASLFVSSDWLRGEGHCEV